MTILGRNLQTLFDALRLHACSIVLEFDAMEFAEPSPSDTRSPFVERITIEDLARPARKEPGKP